jgi:hypothetical protein
MPQRPSRGIDANLAREKGLKADINRMKIADSVMGLRLIFSSIVRVVYKTNY